jgi:hypothetical protein
MKQDARVDLLEMKTYAEIDVNETPIVVLGCGHFFTAETLDGLVGMHDVYVTDKSGRFTGLADISGALAGKIPQCPDCQRPVRQYVTQRYNRVINRAVIDEMSKRFLVNGKTELRGLELQVVELEKELEISRSDVTRSTRLNNIADRNGAGFSGNVAKQIQTRYELSRRLNKEISSFLRKVADRHQPAQKLHEAQIHATRANKSKSLDEALASLSIRETVPPVERDRRITLGGRMVQIKAECIVLEDKFSIAGAAALSAETPKLPGGPPEKLTRPFLQICATFIRDCNTESLPKLAVEASLYFARIVRLYRYSGLSDNSDDGKATEYVNEARELLEKAVELCKQPFQNAKQLKMAAEESIKLLGREWYEAVTSEELASIKQAMVGGAGGIATHSGHWYNCINGHPVRIFCFFSSLQSVRLQYVFYFCINGPCIAAACSSDSPPTLTAPNSSLVASNNFLSYNYYGHALYSLNLSPLSAADTLILVQFAIGECGMPMEQARCPECGAPVGGSNHQVVAGVTRATDMER